MRLAPLALVAVAATGLAACGSSNDKKAASTTTPAAATKSAAITITARDFALSPATIEATAGKDQVTLKNTGKAGHELVILKTDAAPGSLKVTNGRVSEKDSVGEISETPGGSTKSATIDLKPGKYVYVCNVPGHYSDGMHGTLTVQ